MTALAVGLCVVVALFALLVVGLLRSYAAVLVRLEDIERSPKRQRGPVIDESLPTAPDRERSLSSTIVGTSLDGAEVQLTLGGGHQNTLLAFMTSGCTTCQHFWASMHPDSEPSLPRSARLVAVTKDASLESPGRLRDLGADALAVVQSSQAWEDYEVPGSPYFVYVDGQSGLIHSEGTAREWEQVESLLRDAVMDSELAQSHPDESHEHERSERRWPRHQSATERAEAAEQALSSAGIATNDPSFFSLTVVEQESIES